MRVSNPVPYQRKAVRGIHPAVEGNRVRAPCCLLLARLKEKMKGQLNIGVISDTHGQVRSGIYSVFEGVDFILHAGDIGSRDVITELEVIAPVKAVVGNIRRGPDAPLSPTANVRSRETDLCAPAYFS